MAFRKFGVTAVGTLLGGAAASYALRSPEEVLARVEMEGKPIKRARKLPPRDDQITSLQSGEEYDVLIIGGGATGAGCALDACTRGLKTALVEANDFASGTSSRSTKLIHGGVRYLQKAILGVSWAWWVVDCRILTFFLSLQLDLEQYNMVKEALRERASMLESAPHLTHPLPIMLPVYQWVQSSRVLSRG
jgi:glycerol-3-phosphate dehydrogenase